MLTTNIVIVFLVIFVGAVLCLLCSKYSLNSLLWLIAAWSVIIFLYFFSGISYGYAVSSKVWWYISGSFFLFCIFYWIGYHDKIRHKKYINTLKSHQLKIKPLFCTALCGMILYIFDIYRLNQVQIGNRNLNLTVSGIGSIGAILANLSLFIWLYETAVSISCDKLISVYGILSLIIYFIPNVIVGGRQSFIIAGVATIILLFYLLKKFPKYRYKLFYGLACFSLAAAFIIYNIWILDNRELGTTDNQVQFYESIHNAEMDLKTEQDLEKLGPAKSSVLQFMFYYSHELPSLAMVVEEYDTNYGNGAYQFHYIARRIEGVIGDKNSQVEKKLEEISSRSDVHSTSYRTVLSDMIIDFRLWGSMLVVSLIGFLMGKSYRTFREEEAIYELVIQSLLCAAAVFSIEYSPLREIRWIYPFLWAMLLRVYVRYI